MNYIRRLLHLVKPYRRLAAAAMVMLLAMVFLDLTIPRLVQRIIDQGIHGTTWRSFCAPPP